MKKMKRLLALMLVLCMMLGNVTGCGGNEKKTTGEDNTTITVKDEDKAASLTVELTEEGGNMYKYGHLDMDISTEEFLKTFSYGDIVTVEVMGKEYEFPVCEGYGDVDTYGYLIRAGEEKEVVTLGINNGTFGVETGIIEPAADDSENSYQLVDGVDFPISVTITMKEEGGYTDQLALHRLNRTNERSEYPLPNVRN